MRVVLARGRLITLLAQLLNLGAYYLLLMHVQGSLANLLSVPFRLVAGPLVILALVRRQPGLWVLAGLTTGGLSLLYPETALATLAAPAAILATLAWRHWPGPRGVAAPPVVLLVALATCHVALGALYVHTRVNVDVLGRLARTALARPGAPESGGGPPAAPAFAWAQHAPVVLGFASLHDDSVANGRISRRISRASPWDLLFYLLAGSLAAWGFARRPTPQALALSITLVLWGALCLALARSTDFLRFYRALQYVAPYLFTGLALACEGPSGRSGVAGWWERRLASGAIAASLVLGVANVYTVGRTRWFVRSYSFEDSPIIRRWHPEAPLYRRLRAEVTDSGVAPVLITGFPDTVRPFLLANAICEVPHFLGESILQFWRITPLDGRPLGDGDPISFIRWYYPLYDADRLRPDFLRENQPWPELRRQFREASRVALVPPGASYPAEWAQWQDVYPARRASFASVADVVHKYEFAVWLDEATVSPRGRDERGPYRWFARARAPVHVVPTDFTAAELSITYEGNAGDLGVEGTQVAARTSPAGPGLARLQAVVTRRELGFLTLTNTRAPRSVRIRSIDWRPGL